MVNETMWELEAEPGLGDGFKKAPREPWYKRLLAWVRGVLLGKG